MVCVPEHAKRYRGIDMIYKELLLQFTEMSRQLLGDNLTGIYLHGSAAMGCFHPETSDLDLILVVKHGIPDDIKTAFMEHTIKFNEAAPQKGMELSIVKQEFCKPFVYPTPFELHFSAMHLNWFKEDPKSYIEKMNGADKDLAAHFTIINTYGMVLFGRKIEEVFDAVPKECYVDSIWTDIQNAHEDILEHPVYVILNLCRVLAYLKDSLILSKKAGGEWGLALLPQKYHALIHHALQSYSAETKENAIFAPNEMLAFADDMLTQIRLLAFHESGLL